MQWSILAIILAYLAAMMGIGVYFARKITDAREFILSGRSLPWPVVMLTFAATWIGAAATMGRAGLAFKMGLSPFMVIVGSVAALYIFSIMSPRIQQIGKKYDITSIPDIMGRRFGKDVSLIVSVIIAWTLVATLGSQLVATSVMFQFVSGDWGLSCEAAALISSLVMVAYTAFSGLYGVAYTDVVQGLVLLIALAAIVPSIGLGKVGGWAGLKASLPAQFFSLAPDAFLIGYIWADFFYFSAGPPYWQRALASKSQRTASVAFFGGTTLILWYGFMITVLGMVARALYPDLIKGVTADATILLLVQKLLPGWFSALVLAALLAVLMSTCDSYLLNAAQTISCDIWPAIAKKTDDKQMLFLSRVFVVVLGLLAVVFALWIRDIVNAIIFAFTFYASAVSVPVLATLYWRKATRQGILASMFSGLVVSILWKVALNNPWKISQAIPGTVVSLIALIVVSLLTYDPSKEAKFFEP